MGRAHAWLIALALCVGVHAARANFVGFAEYYVLGDEADLIEMYKAIPASLVPAGAGATNIQSRLSVVSSADGVNFYLDEWEDGYDFNPADPYNTADAKWDTAAGNGTDLTNEMGAALSLGQVLTLAETNKYVPGSEGVDGGDRFYITGAPVSVIRTIWPDDPGTYIAGSWELYPVVGWQDAYIVPVGENLSFAGAADPFLYTFLFVEAMMTNTRVVVTDPYDGVIRETVLHRGEHLYLTNVNAGTVVTASDLSSGIGRKVQAGLISSVNGNVDTRFLTLTPERYLGNEYIVPTPSKEMDVGEFATPRVSTNAAYIIALQSNTSVRIETYGQEETILLTNYLDVFRYEMPILPFGEVQGFYAARISAVDTNDKIYVVVSGDDAQWTLDWGYQVLDGSQLSDEVFLPYAPANPVYLSPRADNTTFFVDFDNDGTNDTFFILDRLEMRALYDPDTDATGARIMADGPFACVWGQDHTQQSPGEPLPDYDYGYTVLPLFWFEPVLGITKTADVTNMPPEGGSAEYTLHVVATNHAIYNVDIHDYLPVGWAYESNTTTITFSDGTPTYTNDPSGAPGPTLSWLLDHDLSTNQSITVRFRAQTVTGAFFYGWQRNEGRAWGTDTTNETGESTFVFNPSDIFSIYIAPPPQMSIDKVSSASGPLDPGVTNRYTVTVVNTGVVDQTGVRIKDVLPAGVTYVPGSARIVQALDGATNTVRDAFNAQAYTNNDGTMDWSGPWAENDPYGGGGAGGGYVSVTGDRLQLWYIYVGDERIERAADLSGYTNAVLTYDWETVSLDAGEYVTLLVSTNGGADFVELLDYTGTGSGSASTNISAYISSAFVLRFANTDSNWEGDDYAFFDNIQIEASRSGGVYTNAADAPSVLVPGATLSAGQSIQVRLDATVDVPCVHTQLVNQAMVRSDEYGIYLYDQVTDTVVVASVGERVWNDEDEDGLFDPGESGLAGVTVSLYDGRTNLLDTAVTDADGLFLFYGWPATQYIIGVTAPTNYYVSPKDQGGSETNDSDVNPATGLTDVFDLTRGTNDLRWGAGFYASLSSVGGTVWFDDNTNGIQNGGVETGMPSVVVRLYDANSNLVDSTTTDASGDYVFSGLAFGDYFVRFEPPVGYVLTAQDQGGDDALDSDADAVFAETVLFNLPSGVDDRRWDAGLARPRPGLRISKASSGAGFTLGPGSNILYTIVVENTGTTAQVGVGVVDVLPPGVTLVPGSVEIVAFQYTTNFARDEFNGRAYTNNDGDIRWNTDWIEEGDDGNVTAGDVLVANTFSTYTLRTKDDRNGAYRTLDLSGYTNAVLSFGYSRFGLDASDYYNVYVSTNGNANWVQLDSIVGNSGTDASLILTNYDLTAYIGTNTGLRFYSPDTTVGDAEGMDWDNIQVTAANTMWSTNSGGQPPDLVSGHVLPPGQSMTVRFRVTVDSPSVMTQLVNTAYTYSWMQAPVGASVTDEVAYADLAAAKTVTDDVPGIGDAIEYTLTIANNGPSRSTGITASDVLPDEVQYYAHSNGQYNVLSGVWIVGALDVGASTSLFIRCTPKPGSAGYTITNTVTITASDLYDPVTSNNSARALIEPRPTLAVLLRFDLLKRQGDVVAEWETSSELNTMGFRLYRELEDGSWMGLTEGVIPAEGFFNGGAGAVYEQADATARFNETYRYMLEELETDGVQWHGPFTRSAYQLEMRTQPVSFHNGRFRIGWISRAGESYDIWRTDSLSKPFVLIAEDVQGAPPENLFEDDTEELTTAFYRITVHQE